MSKHFRIHLRGWGLINMYTQLSKTIINLTLVAHPPYIAYGFGRTGRTLSLQAKISVAL
jgi:hypothetical protein